ncbi:MAG: ZIP family metal transporter [Clostridia bacterium]|nr:ZIP family metal transporter [Clostridia bacterium]
MGEHWMIWTGLMIPFLGTALGASVVFFLKGALPARLHRGVLGFAAGIMLAASIWSLLIPATKMAEAIGGLAWLPALAGFLLGVGLLLASDHIPISERFLAKSRSRLGKSAVMVFAVTLHNLPEGMAVGVVLASLRSEASAATVASALALTVGIALQNLPEGAIISMPLATGGMKKSRAFGYGVLSGVVEPLGALLTVLLTAFFTPILPYILSFAAGAMFYVVVRELIPECHAEKDGDWGTVGAALGFALMMVLDIALG